MQEGQPNQYTWRRYLGIAVSRTDRCANFHIFTGTHDYEAYCLCEQGPCQPFWGPTIFHKCRPFFLLDRDWSDVSQWSAPLNWHTAWVLDLCRPYENGLRAQYSSLSGITVHTHQPQPDQANRVGYKCTAQPWTTEGHGPVTRTFWRVSSQILPIGSKAHFQEFLKRFYLFIFRERKKWRETSVWE